MNSDSHAKGQSPFPWRMVLSVFYASGMNEARPNLFVPAEAHENRRARAMWWRPGIRSLMRHIGSAATTATG